MRLEAAEAREKQKAFYDDLNDIADELDDDEDEFDFEERQQIIAEMEAEEAAIQQELQEAENAYFSQVVPVILADGQLSQIGFDGKNWVYQSKEIHAYLPECSIEKNFKDGALIGFFVMSIFIGLWAVNLIIKMIQKVW